MNLIERENLEKRLKGLKEKYGNDRSALMNILTDLQDEYKGISNYIIQEVAHSLNLHPSDVDGTVSFYSFFKRNGKLGKYVIRLCQTISCDMKNKDRIVKQLENELKIKFGQITEDGMFSLEHCNCLGMCDRGPAMMVNNTLISKVKASDIPLIINSCKSGNFENDYKNIIISKVQKKGPLLSEEFENGKALKKAIKMNRMELINTYWRNKLER